MQLGGNVLHGNALQDTKRLHFVAVKCVDYDREPTIYYGQRMLCFTGAKYLGRKKSYVACDGCMLTPLPGLRIATEFQQISSGEDLDHSRPTAGQYAPRRATGGTLAPSKRGQQWNEVVQPTELMPLR